MKTTHFFKAIVLCIACIRAISLNAQLPQFYAATFRGGDSSLGTIVRMNPDGSGFEKVYDFINATGANPMGSLLQNGNLLYGTCLNGGITKSCVLYSYDPDSGIFNDLWNFDIVAGDYPTSGVISGPNGKIYGVGSKGGIWGYGVIYSYDPVSNTYEDVYDFGSGKDTSRIPFGTPVLASDGKLFGMASDGIFDDMFAEWGYLPYAGGNIYSYDISTGDYASVYQFNDITESNGYGSLIQAPNGLLYGMTSGDPYYWIETVYRSTSFPHYFPLFLSPVRLNYGNIFSFDPSSNTYTSLHNFDSINGYSPYGSLTYANAGKLYGVTALGGANNFGTIFSLDPVTDTFELLYSFDSINGAYPRGDLMQSSDGNLYGATFAGGNSFGVFYRFNPGMKSFSVISVLDSATGEMPIGGTPAVFQPVVATGITANENLPVVSVFPVPSGNYETVELQLTATCAAKMNLYDDMGRTVWSAQPELPAGASNTSIDLSCVASGIYLLQVNIDGTKITRRVVVSK